MEGGIAREDSGDCPPLASSEGSDSREDDGTDPDIVAPPSALVAHVEYSAAAVAMHLIVTTTTITIAMIVTTTTGAGCRVWRKHCRCLLC